MDYMIVRSDNISGLEEKVRSEMKSGWKPIGGVMIETQDFETKYKLFFQAMTKGIWLRFYILGFKFNQNIPN